MISFTSDQRFIVTGASSGIGEGVALLLNELGATVIGIGRNEERLAAMKAKAKYPENVFLEPKDLAADISALPDYVKALKNKYGKFQGLACCAGISSVMPLKGMVLSDVKRVFDIDYFSPVFLAKGFLDRRNNNGKGSSFVALASLAAVHPDPGMVAYAGAKSALVASMQSIAREVSNQGVRVNTLSPALIDTPMADEASRAYAEGRYPFGIGKIEDVASFVVYLLSDKSKWVTAQNYRIECAVI